MEEMKERACELKSASEREDKEILQELGKYLDSVVAHVEGKQVEASCLEEAIRAEKEVHKVASELFEKAKQKVHTEEDVDGLLGAVDVLVHAEKNSE
ncbi:uncharacterized protein NEMAJ01_0502 [Nematocida major]|uniref:uncharacterized protein n=1 Tax=Nematocida major TaxID=1912982 RepID=UPI00200743ED|nr:uncharacterized protein NEMAJ01_0502 [Nematocida major]KAH9385606.1 hypothetical protein NEMAJ01_0502 [Nematocida major]